MPSDSNCGVSGANNEWVRTNAFMRIQISNLLESKQYQPYLTFFLQYRLVADFLSSPKGYHGKV